MLSFMHELLTLGLHHVHGVILLSAEAGMEVVTFDQVIMPAMDILTREGKLICGLEQMLVQILLLCRRIVQSSCACMRGLRLTCRIAQRGLRWSAPRCGSWVTAPIAVT